ncbi:uncharacterized protein LOC126563665 [Anopheles maculipalpis]|uniref:uncharacterized protein LOC126563665 n=1 Tax=Anopheles maculipalpis TaxID=1496333 RepID=UPI002158DD93|nr:uncharacterized protein LOC126563665 [Anopheles maculipalpis]
MPFAIVEACEEDGTQELCVVPEGWILDTRHTETILLWPKFVGPKMYKLLNDGDSVGNTTWLKMDCVVKKIDIPNQLVAYEQLLKMKGVSIETPKSTPVRVQKSESPCRIEEDLPESSIQNDISDIRKDKASPVPAASLTGRELTTALKLKHVSEIDLINFLRKMEGQIFVLEVYVRKVNDKLVRLESIAQLVLQKHGITAVETIQHRSPMINDLEFEQIDTLESMEAFNENLQNPVFQEQIFHWLDCNITDDKSENRMTEAIDLLFTKKFMTKCSWTGVGRGSEKIAMMRMVNITKLFRRIGTCDDVVMNPRMVMLFFMKKLRNAGRRSEMKHLRRSTTHYFKSNKTKSEN